MSGSLDGDFVVWLALALAALIEGGLLQLTAPEGDVARVSLTDAGATCYAELSAKQQAALQVPPPEHATQTPAPAT